MRRKITPTVFIICLLTLLSIHPFAIQFVKAEVIQTNNNDKEFVPTWAKSAIWYQIFPERFRDGDPSNNPTVIDIVGADPEEKPKFWRIHPWGSDWYKRQNYELKNGEAELWKHLLRRRYGGDIQGIIDKIGYLKNLGINAIYLNPVFDSPSLHKYDAASYHHIDPNFGPNPQGDRALIDSENPLDVNAWVWTEADKLMLKLINKLHQNDIKIIFDGVFNHMGINSFAFQNLLRNQQSSPYTNWFNVTSFRDEIKDSPFEYEGWYGVKSLPVFKEDQNGIVKGPRDYIFAATQRWMNPRGRGTKFGIDGWRLDVAFEIHHNFWKDWRKQVKSINPDAFLTAEIVDTPEKVVPYFQGDEFDGEMNYNFAFTVAEFLFHSKVHKITATQFDIKLKQLRQLYPKGVASVTQNLFGSHDSNRIASHIVNRDIGNFRNWGKYFSLSKAAENPNYKVRKPNKKEIRLQKLFVIFQMTYLGAPMIYYGDEVGMWGANDPDCRKPMLWTDIIYQDEKYIANGKMRAADKVEINFDLKEHYQKLINIRKKHSVFQLGEFKTLMTDDLRELYLFQRYLKQENNEAQTAIVAINNSDILQQVEIPTSTNTCYTELLTNTKVKSKDNKLTVSIEAKWGMIWIKDTTHC